MVTAAAVATDELREVLLDELASVGAELVRAGWVDASTSSASTRCTTAPS